MAQIDLINTFSSVRDLDKILRSEYPISEIQFKEFLQEVKYTIHPVRELPAFKLALLKIFGEIS